MAGGSRQCLILAIKCFCTEQHRVLLLSFHRPKQVTRDPYLLLELLGCSGTGPREGAPKAHIRRYTQGHGGSESQAPTWTPRLHFHLNLHYTNKVLPTTRAMLEGGSGAAAGRSGWPVSKAFLPLSPRCHHGPRSALLALLLPPCWQIFTSLALRPLLCMDSMERIYRHVFTLLGAGRGPGTQGDREQKLCPTRTPLQSLGAKAGGSPWTHSKTGRWQKR
ncbi:uncharacterized protein LOC118007781 [Mirounga leonina]|uniref:uncharacterized protein LOC118007781 n=1 Tax=Mirounga leonina TaxID=9715 RepID=UPI00156C3396|nr:uncharacterized protein LOC118007781 [Mirounga leonina]